MWTSDECPEYINEGSTTASMSGESPEGNTIITDGSTSYIIKHLREGTNFTITVTAYNAVSSANSSSESRTQEIGQKDITVM